MVLLTWLLNQQNQNKSTSNTKKIFIPYHYDMVFVFMCYYKSQIMEVYMNLFDFDSLDSNVAERMMYIDFKLQYTGFINRSDLKHMFGLAEAASSRMMTMYSEQRPNNMKYNAKLRVNEAQTETFEPLLRIDPEVALGMLANGFNKNKLLERPELPYIRVGAVKGSLKTEQVQKITRAMASGYAIKCKYLSSSSDNHNERVLLPLKLIFDGRNWIFRAFYRKKNGNGVFRNFNFSRTREVIEDKSNQRNPFESLAHDKEWNTQVPLMLIPHPDLDEKRKASLEADFGLTDSKLIITERIALLWFIYDLWHVDTRTDTDDDENGKYKFKLTNLDMINAVKKSLDIPIN